MINLTRTIDYLIVTLFYGTHTANIVLITKPNFSHLFLIERK